MQARYKWSKTAIFIAMIAACCLLFAGMASAAPAASIYVGSYDDGDQTIMVKADHTYGFNIDINDISAIIENFTDENPPECGVDTNKLWVQFPEGFKLTDDYTERCEGAFYSSKAVDVWITLNDGSEPFLVRVVPEAWTIDNDCQTVVDKIYFPIESQNLPLITTPGVVITDVAIRGLELITPNNPGTYRTCVGHTTDCIPAGLCQSLRVVETVDSIVDVTLEGCPNTDGDVYVAGQPLTVTGQVMSTALDENCENVPWQHNSWPVLIEIKKVVDSCDKCLDTVCGFEDAMEPMPVTEEDDCGNPTVVSCGEEVLCAVVAHTNRDGYFQGTIDLPACLKDQGKKFRYVVRVSTIEVQDANRDDLVEFRNEMIVSPGSVPYESLEDLDGESLDEPSPPSLKADDQTKGLCNNNDADGRHHIALQVIDTCVAGIPLDLEHAWVQADLMDLTIVPGEPWYIKMKDVGPQINFGFDYVAGKTDELGEECVDEVPIEVCLYDKYGNITPNTNPCDLNAKPIKVEFLATWSDVEGQLDIAGTTAGKFYKDGNEITYAIIGVGETCVTGVTFVPNKVGYVDITATSIFMNGERKSTGWCEVEVNDCVCIFEGPMALVESTDCNLEGCEYGCDGMNFAAAGWPVKFSVHYDPTTLRVELFEYADGKLSAIDPDEWNVSWDTDLVKNGYEMIFGAAGANASGDTFAHPAGNVPYDNAKSDFYVYTDMTACGKWLVVKVVDTVNNRTQISCPIYFGTPTDMVRVMHNGWNLVSTPVNLAGDGNMKTLFMDEANPDGKAIFEEILTFVNGGWVMVGASEELQPLNAYYVNMNQNFCVDCCELGDCGQQKPIYANFIFDRVADPRAAMLPTKTLQPGLNLVGPAFNVDEVVNTSDTGDDAWFSYRKDCGYFEYDPCCNDCQCLVPTDIKTPQACPAGGCESIEYCGDLCKNAVFQTDRLYRMLGTVGAGSKMVVNPGGSGLRVYEDPEYDYVYKGQANALGNLAPWTTAILGTATEPSWEDDPYYRAFNGDGYWLYVSDTPQTMVGSATKLLVSETDLCNDLPK